MKIPSEGKSHRGKRFNPYHLLCSDRYIALIIADSGISIHAPREGGDLMQLCHMILRLEFQSTPPVKAATHRHNVAQCIIRSISIHAAREGGDPPVSA